MSTAKITLISFNKYLYENDGVTLFDDLVLPSGIDKDVLTGNILLRGGEFEVLYSDPYFLKDAVSLWGKKWYRTFEKWINALNLEYNPLENYDRKEDYSDTLNKGVKTSSSGTSNNTQTLNTQDNESMSNNQSTEHTVSAYDSGSYQPSSKDVVNGLGTDNTSHTGTISDSGSVGSSGSETENSKTVHDGRIHGNIGVTTSQQMLESELKIAEWNIYEHITDLFLSEFIIPIYS